MASHKSGSCMGFLDFCRLSQEQKLPCFPGAMCSAGMSMLVPLLSSLVVNWLERSYVEADRELLFLAVPQHYISLKKCFFSFLNEQ